MAMVKTVTSFGRSGLSDWLLQRATAIVLAVYVIFMMGYLIIGGTPTFERWHALHQCTAMRIFSSLVLLSIVVHAWIGLWSVLTDYLTARFFKLELGVNIGDKATVLRLLCLLGAILLLLAYAFWGLAIVWRA